MLNPRMPNCWCGSPAVIQWAGGSQCAAHNDFYAGRRDELIKACEKVAPSHKCESLSSKVDKNRGNDYG